MIPVAARGAGVWRALTLATILAAADGATAQIVTDGTVGPGVRLNGRSVAIDADLGARRGPNLFHSFKLFGVRRGGSATFEAPPGAERIIARVTGGRVSAIDGAIASTAPVDLYLVNSAGVILGRDARIDTDGALFLSTADALEFADATRFPTTPGAALDLSVAEPTEFDFTDSRGGAIRFDGVTMRLDADLVVGADEVVADGARIDTGSGAALALGSRSTLVVTKSDLGAPGGEILLTARSGTLDDSRLDAADITIDSGMFRISSGGAPVFTLTAGLLELEGGATILARPDDGARGVIFAPTVLVSASAFEASGGRILGPSQNPGTFVLNVGQLSFTDNATLSLTGAFAIAAERIRLQNSNLFLSAGENSGLTLAIIRAREFDLVGSDLVLFGAEAPGDDFITIEVDRLRVLEDSFVGFATEGAGGGLLSVMVDDYMLVGDSFVLAQGLDGGNSGFIEVAGGLTVLRDGAVVGANAEDGEAGIIDLTGTALLQEPGTAVEAISDAGPDGIVTLGRLLVPNTAETEPLPTGFFDAFALIDDACVAAVAGGSALSREGRGGQAFSGAAQPGLFNGALPYPSAAPSGPAPVGAEAPRVDPCPAR